MSIEYDPDGSSEPKQADIYNIEALDLRWYERYDDLASFGMPEMLVGDKELRDEQKEAFLNGEIDHPTLDLPRIDLEDLEQREQGLLFLKEKIILEEPNDVVKQAYRWRINEKIAQLRMLRAAKQGDMRRFERYNHFIYGKPSQEIYAYTVQTIRDQAEAVLENNKSTEPLRRAAEDVLNTFAQPNRESGISLPSQEIFNTAKQVTMAEMMDIVDIEPFEGKIDAEAIAEQFERALQKRGIAKSQGGNWQIIIEHGDTSAIYVSPNEEVKVPSNRRLTFTELVEKTVHEIGTHVVRDVNGKRSRLMLLRFGLDRTGLGEEGVATMRETVVTKDLLKEFPGVNHYLGISLAEGLDGTPSSFTRVHKMITTHRYFRQLLAGREPERAMQLAKSAAYTDCVRIFRGTDCVTPGVSFNQDMAYRRGSIGVFALISTREGQQEMLRFSIGGYDPTNPRHIWILDQLGISEEDLARLEL